MLQAGGRAVSASSSKLGATCAPSKFRVFHADLVPAVAYAPLDVAFVAYEQLMFPTWWVRTALLNPDPVTWALPVRVRRGT